jgi:hypothetical protein|tara:strand:- start:1026 stop:1466 length:441 start_codon:yes stop_codon:yes gene_type:complete
MEYAADDINIGYMTCLMFINSEHTLIDKLNNITEIQPNRSHAVFTHITEIHQGGVSFDLITKSMPTYVKITMNYNGNFDILTRTTKGQTEFKDETVETLINFLHIFYVNMVDDENKLLLNALDKNTYRKAAKTMHYREMFGDDAAI